MNPDLNRRDLLTATAGAALSGLLPDHGFAAPARPRRVAGITTVYYHNSHADLILGRLLETDSLDGKGGRIPLQLASLYLDQIPANDTGRRKAKQHGVPIYGSIAKALTLGGETLAVDGVLLIAEHGKYPANDRGADLLPRKRFFDEAVAVMKRSGRVVPVFNDKHLAPTWAESKAMYDTARALKIPFMAGSSLPVTWRRPALDVRRGAPLREIVGVSYHTLWGYGFHGMEMIQCLAEQRRGGETGVRRVQCLEGPAVWEAGRAGLYDLRLLDAALARQTRGKPADLEKSVANPVLFHMEYRDGFKASMLTLNGAVAEWSVAWQEEGAAEPQATRFEVQETRPFGHFTLQLAGIEQLLATGKPAWPVERTLLTSGMLDFLLASKAQGHQPIDTPELAIRYQPTWNWLQPPPPPPDRPLDAP